MTAMRDRKAELEREIGALIRERLPQASGRDVEVEMAEKEGGASGEMRIVFTASVPAGGEPSPDALGDPASRRRDIIEALVRAEVRVGYRSISLDWFRDGALSDEFAWARQYSARAQALDAAIGDGVILTGKGYDPRAPDCPLATVRLNRLHPETAEILAEKFPPSKRKPWYPPGEPSPPIYPEGWDDPTKRRGFDFPRIQIRGKPLSQTVIEERRSGW